MSKEPLLSVVIPTRNSSGYLPLTLAAIDRFLAERDYPYELLLVSDGSDDRTAEIAERMKDAIRNLRVVDNPAREGLARAVRGGMLVARGRYRVYLHDRSSVSVSCIETILPLLEAGNHIVFGSRIVPGSERMGRESWDDRVNRSVRETFARRMGIMSADESQYIAMGFSAEAAEKLFSEAQGTRVSFHAEILRRGTAHNLRIKEIPVRWHEESAAPAPFADHLKSLWETATIRWRT